MVPLPAIRHTYASVAEFNDYLTTSGSGLYTNTTNNAQKLEWLQEASRLADHKCHRGSGFGPYVQTRYYDADGGDTLYLRGDLSALAASGLSITDSFGETPVTPTVATDFFLAGIGTYDEPYRRILLHGEGTPTTFGNGLKLTSVTGTWSYPYRTRLTAVLLDEAVDTDDTTFDVSSLTGLSPGMTILVDSEQMYVTATTDSTPDTITVERGVNGTTAASHLDEAPITRYVYNSNVHDFTMRIAEKRMKARDAGADGSDGGADVGTLSLREGEDTIVRRMLGPLILVGYV